jgi:hypothetical protein
MNCLSLASDAFVTVPAFRKGSEAPTSLNTTTVSHRPLGDVTGIDVAASASFVSF